MRWTFCCLLVLTVLTANTQAQEETQTKHEVWPEVDIFIPLNPHFRLVVFANSTKASETRDSVEAQAGTYVDYFWKKRVTLRSGYYYDWSLVSSDPYSENTVLFEQTIHKSLDRQFVLTNRNRQEFRWINKDFSMRFRHRLQLEKSFPIRTLTLVPYGSAEIMYDTRYSTFNRDRLITGTQFVFKKRDVWLVNVRRQHVLDLYYLWQDDTRSQTKHLRAFGISFEVHF